MWGKATKVFSSPHTLIQTGLFTSSGEKTQNGCLTIQGFVIPLATLRCQFIRHTRAKTHIVYSHFGGWSLWWCGTDLCYTDVCFYYFVHPIYINNDRLDDRNTSLYNAVQQQNKLHPSKLLSCSWDLSKKITMNNEGGFIAELLY